MEGPTSHFFFSQRLRLHYVDWGNEGAPPLLLVHGGRDHCRNWDWVAQRLRSRFHIIAPDLRGHGDSAWAIGGGYDQSGYVYDLAQLIHQKSMTPVTIIAHSLGAGVALNYTGAFSRNVKKLVAIEGRSAIGKAPLGRLRVHLVPRQQFGVASRGPVDGVTLRHLRPCALMIDGIPRRSEDMPGASGARP